jgi:glutamate--cysteine ligase
MQDEEYQCIARNHALIVHQGRDPDLILHNGVSQTTVPQWGNILLAMLGRVAQLLDEAQSTQDYTKAIEAQRAKFVDASCTPSAQLLAELKQEQLSFSQWALKQSQKHADYFNKQTPSAMQKTQQQTIVANSYQQQRTLEASDTVDFETYRQQYVANL